MGHLRRASGADLDAAQEPGHARARSTGRRSSRTSGCCAGDAIEITVPCSGGYGDPVERDPKLVLDDVLDGFTSLEQAREIYRVAIDPETLTLDEEETARLRAAVGVD